MKDGGLSINSNSLQVYPESLYPENNLSRAVPKDTVYIKKSVAETFHLSNYKSIVVNKVSKDKVGLDSVELLFKVSPSQKVRPILTPCLTGAIPGP